MQHYNTPMGNAWTHGNMPKYIIKMPQGANTDTISSNGTQPNQNFEKNFPKSTFPTPFSKITNSRNLTQFLHILREKGKDC